MLNALIVDCRGDDDRARVCRARQALEDSGWETLVLRRDPEDLERSMAELASRYVDCDLALLFHVPAGIRRALQRQARRPTIGITSPAEVEEEGRARLVV